MENNVTIYEAKGLDCANVLRAQLYSKIELVANAIGALEKDGNNSFSRYKYITHEAVTTAIRPLLVSHSLSVVMDIEDYNERDFETKNSKGEIKVTTRTVMICRFYITDTETGYQESHRWIGAEQDNGGKSMQQAATQANKYFLFKLFKITDKESDSDSVTNEVTKPVLTPEKLKAELSKAKTNNALTKIWKKYEKIMTTELKQLFTNRKNEINKVDK